MKKKVILLSLALMLLVTGVVSAASLWGKFEGFNVIRIAVNGKTITGETPAINFKGRTMVPIYMLKDAGVNYQWNGATQTVEIAGYTQFDSIGDLSKYVESVKNILKTNGVPYVDYSMNIDEQGLFAYSSYDTALRSGSFNQTIDLAIISSVASILKYNMDGTIIDIINGNSKTGSAFIAKEDTDSFANKEISFETYVSRWTVNNFVPNTISSSTETNTSTKIAKCASINKNYDDQIRAFEESYGAAGMGRSTALKTKISNLEEARSTELKSYACSQ